MSASPDRLPSVAYAVSGACALVFQVVWYHAFTEQFGASGTTFLVVLCSFIGGLGLGSLASKRFYAALERRFGGHGLRNYGRTELAVAFAALVFFGLTRLPPTSLFGSFPYRPVALGELVVWTPIPAAVAAKLLLAVLAVGGPCFLMGLTFPYLCALDRGNARTPSRLYAANTLGACLAVAGTEFWGLRALGYLGSFFVAFAGAVALGLWFARQPETEPRAVAAAPSDRAMVPTPSMAPAVVSGFLCGGLQALLFVLIKFVVGPSRATFALLSFFSILGIWISSRIVNQIAPRRGILLASAWVALGWCVWMWTSEPGLSEALLRWGAFSSPFTSASTAALVTTFLDTGLVIFVPYALWSLLLPDLCDRQQACGMDLSVTYGLNTFAFLAGVLTFGWALQYVNVFYAARVFAVAAAALLALLTLAPREGPVGAVRVFAAVAVAAAGIAFVPRSLALRLVGGREGEAYAGGPWRSTPQHLFWVRPNPDGSRALMFDGHSMSGTNPGGQAYMRAMAHVPMLVHAGPRRVLLICFGVGVTADAIRMHQSVSGIDVVDLNPSVFALNDSFVADNGHVLADKRLRLVSDDGRQFLRVTEGHYDFVTMEPPPPLQPGISRLYSAEFYDAVRSHLNPGGVVSQWLPDYQMDEHGVDLIVSTFVQAFRHTFLLVGYGRELILVGSDAPFAFGHLRERLSREPAVRFVLERYGLGSSAALLSTILRPDGSLRARWGNGPVIRDGFASLDVLQISNPVQQLHPKGTWLPLKPDLRYDRNAVISLVRAEAPEDLPEVMLNLADPRRLARTVPPFYAAPLAGAGPPH